MKHLVARFTARPGTEPEVDRLLTALTVEVRAEPGCVRFDPFICASQPREYYVFESYASDEAFVAHLASEHSQTFNSRLGDLIVGAGSELTFLAPVRSTSDC